MTLTVLHSNMFDVGDLPVLTFGNCVLNTDRGDEVVSETVHTFLRF